MASANCMERSRLPSSSGTSKGSQLRTPAQAVAAHGLRLADLAYLLQGGGHEGDGDRHHHGRRVVGARHQAQHGAHGQDAVEHAEGRKETGQHEAVERAVDQRLQRQRAAEQRQPCGQDPEHVVAHVHHQHVKERRGCHHEQAEAQHADFGGGRLFVCAALAAHGEDRGDHAQDQRQVERVARDGERHHHAGDPDDPGDGMGVRDGCEPVGGRGGQRSHATTG